MIQIPLESGDFGLCRAKRCMRYLFFSVKKSQKFSSRKLLPKNDKKHHDGGKKKDDFNRILGLSRLVSGGGFGVGSDSVLDLDSDLLIFSKCLFLPKNDLKCH